MSAMNPSKDELEGYINENYGSCILGMGKCHCDGPRWHGCPHWRPIEGEDREKLIAAWGKQN